MDATSALVESLAAKTPPRKKRERNSDTGLPTVADFFGDPLPPSPDKPALPEILRPFEMMHRAAAVGAIPADKATEIIEAIHAAADRIGKPGQLRMQSCMDDLADLDDWYTEWSLQQVVPMEPDPFTACPLCRRGIGEPAEGCDGKHIG